MDLHHVHLFASDMGVTLAWWQRHLGACVLFDGRLAGSRNVLIGVGTGRINIYDQPPRDGGRGAMHHIGVRVPDLAAAWPKLQAIPCRGRDSGLGGTGPTRLSASSWVRPTCGGATFWSDTPRLLIRDWIPDHRLRFVQPVRDDGPVGLEPKAHPPGSTRICGLDGSVARDRTTVGSVAIFTS